MRTRGSYVIAHYTHKRVRRGVYDFAACSPRAVGDQVEEWEHVTCPLCLRLRGKGAGTR